VSAYFGAKGLNVSVYPHLRVGFLRQLGIFDCLGKHFADVSREM
jgi:hypothetical protein